MNRMIALLITCLILFLTGTASGQYPGSITGLQIDGSSLRVQCGPDLVVFRVCSSDILMVNLRPNGIEDPDTLIIDQREWTPSGYSFDTTMATIRITGAKFHVDIQRSPMRFSIFDSAGAPLFHEPSSGGLSAGGINLSMQNQTFYGLRNTQSGSLSVGTGGIITSGSQGQAGAPFIWTPGGWGMLADMDTGRYTVSPTLVTLTKVPNPVKRDLEIYFLFGTPKQLLAAASEVSGKPPLFPRFSLGFLNTEWGIDENELLSDVSLYRAKGIPIDAYILDFDWMAWGENNYGEFRFGSKFPSGPGGRLKDTLLTKGVKLFGIRKPRIHRYTDQGQYAESNNYFLGYKTDYFSGQIVGLLNFHKPEVRAWYWNNFISRGDAYTNGIIGYWNDEADEFGGNSMFLQMQRAEYEGQRAYNNRRVWSINRNFMLGAQRYAYALWSGDIGTGFSVMSAQTKFMTSSVLLGASWWGMDIGGFSGTPSPENYYRWIQFGAFVPVYRVHGTFGQEREPWHYGAEAESIAAKFIRLRYTLLPYIYTAARENHLTGLSLVRPLILEYPDDIATHELADQWLFGNDLLVKPVLSAGATSVSVYLPAGVWIDYWTGTTYYGPATAHFPVKPSTIPLFVRAGAVLPTSPPHQFSEDTAAAAVLFLSCYPGAPGSGSLYEDDGMTYDYEQGIYSTTTYAQTRTTGRADLHIGARSGLFSPPARDLVPEFYRLTSVPDSVLLDAQLLPRVALTNLLTGSLTGWAYDTLHAKALVRFPDNGGARHVSLRYMPDFSAPAVDSVVVASRTSINIYFNEPVLAGDSSAGAENTGHYEMSDSATVDDASLSPDHRTVTLSVSPLQPDKEYTLTIRNIADDSPKRNRLWEYVIQVIFMSDSLFQIDLQEGLNGYSGTTDAHVTEFSPDNNTGGYQLFEACRFGGNSDNDDKSALVRFDLSGFSPPRGNLVRAEVVLTLATTRNGSVEKTLSSYRLLKPWNEGTISTGIDGDPATTGIVTWRSALHNILLWSTPGGDHVPVPSDTRLVGGQPGVEYSWDVTGYMNIWMQHPDSNYGIILKEPGVPSAQSGTKAFYSRNHAAETVSPRLVLTYKYSPVGVGPDAETLPTDFALEQNYPNPFNPTTNITFQIPRTTLEFGIWNLGFVSLKVYDILGREVATLVDGVMSAGVHSVRWDAGDMAGGVYLYRITAGRWTETKKMLVIR